MKRRSPTRDELQATAYLAITRNGVPIVSREEAKHLTAREIIEVFESRVDWHHNIEHAIGGSMHPTNLDPIPPVEHKKIPSATRVAKAKRISKENEEFQRRLLSNTSPEPIEKPASKLKSKGFPKVPRRQQFSRQFE